MADVTVDIGGHSYTITCRDGEEAHLRGVASVVDKKAIEARNAVGGTSETRQLLFASLLLADELAEMRQSGAALGTPTPPAAVDHSLADAIERVAARLEALANRLENGA